MTPYLWVKLVHILSATVLFGTGLGTAFFMLRAYLSRNDEAMAVVVRSVVIADWIFTTPAVLIQLATGLWLANRLGIARDSAWFVAVMLLYVLAGLCWLPVVAIQIRIRGLMARGATLEACSNLMRTWIALGIPAFTAVLVLFYLMVAKTGAYG